MQNKTLFVAFIALLLVCTGCDIKKHNDAISKFVGTYDLTIEYEVYIDGELSVEEPDYMNGTLTITAIDNKTVNVVGVVNFKGNYANLYETTGTVDDKGVLHLANSEYTAGSAPIEIHYNDIEYASPLIFKSNMLTSLQGYELEYKMNNTATKK